MPSTSEASAMENSSVPSVCWVSSVLPSVLFSVSVVLFPPHPARVPIIIVPAKITEIIFFFILFPFLCQPFTAPANIPRISCFCPTIKIDIEGIITITTPAIISVID